VRQLRVRFSAGRLPDGNFCRDPGGITANPT
jgi:hypothetical protein